MVSISSTKLLSFLDEYEIRKYTYMVLENLNILEFENLFSNFKIFQKA